jgi:hypothetical protein
MSTVKLTELPLITSLDVNESNTIFVVVDTDSDTTAKITLSTLYSNVNSYLTSNAASANAVINSRITANADSANSVINTRITANVATLRGEITANADSANSVINTRITANVATLRGEITANAASANSVINTNISANVATLRGEITANADSANSVINTRITANATSTNAFANLAFTKANNAIANTGGVYTAGDFYISGDGFVNGTFTLANSNFGATESAMTITATGTVQTVSQAGTMLHITGKANTPSRIIFDSFSTDGSAYSIVAGRTARGTVVSPTATQNNDVLMRFAGNGWGTTGFAPLGVARIDIVASENYTDSARGSRILFYNIANGSNTVHEIASFNAETVQFDGTVQPNKGFIYVPTILEGSQTAFTINFSTTSLIKCNIAADCAITLSNYVHGKVVEVWITNTSGSNRTVTHGCMAINSTVNSTTVTVPSTSSAYLRYFSIDGDNANTFVAIQSA